jgi:hypothetical protein
MTGDDFRRLLPPPRRRPGPISIVVRWRIEIAAVVVAALAVHVLGGRSVAICAVACVALLITSPGARRAALGVVRAVVIPHRVRAGLVQAGVADRAGRLPWLVAARPHGDAVRVTVWLRAGTSLRDLLQATPLIATACGARDVDVERYSARQDRAVLIVIRPRWGSWSR